MLSLKTYGSRPWLLAAMWFIYVLAILAVAFPHGLKTQFSLDRCESVNPGACNPPAVNSLVNLADFENYYGASDPGSYMRGGAILAANPRGFYNLSRSSPWPPGMYLMHGIRIRYFSYIPPFLWLGAWAAALWGVIFTMVFRIASIVLPVIIAAIVPLLLLFLPMYADFFFHVGLVMGEPFSAGFLAIMVIMMLYGVRRNNVLFIACAGFAGAFAAFFREQADIILLQFATLMALASIIAFLWKNFYPVVSRKVFLGFIGFAAIFFAVTGAYRIYNHGMVHMDYVWSLPYTLPVERHPETATFLAGGGMSTACLADSVKCDNLRRRLNAGEMIPPAKLKKDVERAVILHPMFVLRYKGPIIIRYWFSPNKDLANSATGDAYAENILYLVLLMGTIGLCLFHRDQLWASIILLLILCTGIGCTVPSIFMHFEIRYFFLLKSMAVILFMAACFFDLQAVRGFLARQDRIRAGT